jgi:hypothetical protein
MTSSLQPTVDLINTNIALLHTQVSDNDPVLVTFQLVTQAAALPARLNRTGGAQLPSYLLVFLPHRRRYPNATTMHAASLCAHHRERTRIGCRSTTDHLYPGVGLVDIAPTQRYRCRFTCPLTRSPLYHCRCKALVHYLHQTSPTSHMSTT